ncbi:MULTISPECIES: ATP-binding protein [Thermoanaerobacteraceae]|uniref:AAA family ATPase n=1 Tax=Caldanaerobacter subterraneus TaxID=911092 RepID=A0A4V2S5X5_9THEO|nr:MULTISPECIES: ATP-binding protein [Thermoanaerobacteraceae]TCO53850.1 hypothetical protein EV203_1621 [Caldanaerobacter subterraneus]UZQ82693.1 ATP-binding protein [Thermoanaerobacter sp. RKWS2]SFE41993.1 hypothetical protein SAMN04324257_01652 [Thermoanaerobacter thermohydrosulfuricus]
MSITSSENILRILYSYNPWWREGYFPQDLSKPVKRVVYHQAFELLMHPAIRRYVILSGARRVGKTTILYQMIETLLKNQVHPKKILYVSFDHPLFKLSSFDQIINLYETAINQEKEAYIFLDEIQYASDWDRWLKVYYDTKPNWRIIATGSASPALIEGTKESGVGRWTVISVPTLSFYEFCEILGVPERPNNLPDLDLNEISNLNESQLSELIFLLMPLQKYFNKYLTIGGFPEFVFSEDQFLVQRILREDVVDKVIKRDIPSLFNVRNLAVLEKVFLYLCFNSASVINISTISKEIGDVSTVTVENYIHLLENANLIYKSLPIELGGKKVLKAKPKIYVSDPALRNAVLMIDNILLDSKELGITVETAIFKHIYNFYLQTNARIGYFRKSSDNQKEIDVVVEFPHSKSLIEVKFREDTTLSENEAIVEMSQKEKNIASAVLVTKRPEDYGKVKISTKVPIIKIPAYAFMYLFGRR